MNNEIVKNIKNKLLQPLPGLEFQAKMAPSKRLENYNPNPEFARKGGVLLFLYDFDNEPYIALIKRAKDGGAHSGQIAFPGGKHEKHDKSLIETALRETEEEIGININKLEILGTLTNLYIPVSNYNVYPTVGFCNSEPNFNINKTEVEKMILLPLREFFNPENLKSGILIVKEQEIQTPFYEINNQIVWGATAMIISEFLEVARKVFLYLT
jgi:8-oxo-dGTP pyrophosphatase MutT (NUDIX family)